MSTTSNKNTKDKLDEVLDIESDDMEVILPEKTETNVVDTTKLDEDYDDARISVKMILSKGEDALQEALENAIQRGNARDFEVFATLAKTLIDGNGSLLDLAKKKKDIKGEKGAPSPTSVTNQIIHTGTTTDLLKEIKKNSK